MADAFFADVFFPEVPTEPETKNASVIEAADEQHKKKKVHVFQGRFIEKG